MFGALITKYTRGLDYLSYNDKGGNPIFDFEQRIVSFLLLLHIPI